MAWWPTFLNGWSAALAGAIVIPSLLILYFLKLRRREFTVPSTLLWKRAVQDLQGDLKLRDMEDDDMAEVSITQPLLKQYKANLNAYCLGLKDYVTRRGGTYLFTSTTVPFDTLVLNYLRERGLLG